MFWNAILQMRMNGFIGENFARKEAHANEIVDEVFGLVRGIVGRVGFSGAVRRPPTFSQ